RKEFELHIKEKEIQQRAAGEKELGELRQELHERERKLDKRQDLLDQQADQLRKQESMVENNQRKLAEQIANTKKRNEDLDQLIADQRHKLHDLSGLSKAEATEQLLSALQRELQQEAGALIVKHEKQVAEKCEERTREILITALQRYAAPHTAGTTTSTVDIPSDEMK